MRRVVFTWLALVVLAVLPTPAHACSCVGPHPSRHVSPRDGAIDFPIDGVVRVLLSGFGPTQRAAVGAEYRLRDAAGALVALDVAQVETRIDLRPHDALIAGATYTLETIAAYDASGARLTDLQRMSATGPLRGIWSTLATFTTAASAAPARTLVPTLTNAQLFFPQGGGDCGPATSVATDLTLPTGVLDTDMIELRTRHGVVETRSALGTSALYAGDALCNPDPVTLPAGASIEVRAVLVDASGHDIGASAWRRARGHGTRRPSRRRAPDGAWPGTTIIAAPSQSTMHGPGSCAFGLEVVSRHDVVGAGAPWSYGERTTISSDGAARFITYGSGVSAGLLFSLDADGSATSLGTTRSGLPDAVIATTLGPILSSVDYAVPLHPVGSLSQLDVHGAVTWSTAMPSLGTDHRMARGGGQILVAWSQSDGGITPHLAYALFDEHTGAMITSEAPTSFGLDLNSEGPAVAFVDGRFLIVWGASQGIVRGALMSLVVSAATATRQVLSSVEAYAPPDVASAGTRAGLATTTRDGRVLLSTLDRDGVVASGPFEVSRGIGGTENRLPRIAWNGSGFAVAWETYPTPGVYVAIADASGAISPALRVDDDEAYAGSIGVTATAHGWLAGYTAERGRGVVTELRCASHAIGPPQAIGAMP